MASPGLALSGELAEVYRLMREAVTTRRPIAAIYDDHRRLFCPHRLGRNAQGQLRALCYQFGGESRSGLKRPGSKDNWRCVAVAKLSQVTLLDGEWRTASNHSRPASCVSNPDVDADDFPTPACTP